MHDIKIGSSIANYEVVAQIARDDLGVALGAREKTSGNPVYLRVLDAQRVSRDSVQRFRQVVDVVKRISHPNILTTYGAGETEVGCYVAQELVKGESIAAFLQRNGPIAVHRALQIAGQLLRGLKGAHDRGLVHGLVHPGNIAISSMGNVVLTDFGVLHLVPFDKDHGKCGLPEHLIPYMAPELRRAESPGPESDLYSVGTILYEMIVGSKAFKAMSLSTTAGEAFAGLSTSGPDAPAVLPGPVRPIIARMTDRDRHLRYPDFESAISDLKSLLDSGSSKNAPAMRGNIYVGEHTPPKAAGESTIEDALGDFDLTGARSSSRAVERPLVRYGKVDRKPINVGAIFFGATIVLLVVAVAGLLYQLVDAGVFSHLGGGGWVDLLSDESLGNWDNPRQTGNLGEWHIEGGVLCNRRSFQGQIPLNTLDIATEDIYQDFELTFEYRADANTNSGVYLRGSVEIQLLEGADGTTKRDVGYNGAIFGLHAPQSNATRPVGSWNAVYIRYVGNLLTVQLNGTTIHTQQTVGKVTDSKVSSLSNNPGTPGPIMLQNHTGKIWFRDMHIRPLNSGR